MLLKHFDLTAGVRHVSVEHMAEVQWRRMDLLYRGQHLALYSYLSQLNDLLALCSTKRSPWKK